MTIAATKAKNEYLAMCAKWCAHRIEDPSYFKGPDNAARCADMVPEQWPDNLKTYAVTILKLSDLHADNFGKCDLGDLVSKCPLYEFFLSVAPHKQLREMSGFKIEPK